MGFSKKEVAALTKRYGGHKTTPEQREAAIKEYALEGTTLKQLAERYGVTISTVHGWLTRARLKAREGRL